VTTPIEKEEHVRIYEEIKQRQAAYAAAHPGRYYLLSDYEMDDIASYHQIEGLRAAAERRRLEGKPPPPPSSAPKRSLIQACLECGFIDARWERRLLTSFEASLAQAVAEINGNVIKLNPKN
jgi:hypothetical protein